MKYYKGKLISNTPAVLPQGQNNFQTRLRYYRKVKIVFKHVCGITARAK
jgi:hypothetical protein